MNGGVTLCKQRMSVFIRSLDICAYIHTLTHRHILNHTHTLSYTLTHAVHALTNTHIQTHAHSDSLVISL